MSTSDVYWSDSVIVVLQNGLERTFTSILDALDFLENEWPIKAGLNKVSAIAKCRGALNKSTPSAVAREQFIAACLEAGFRLRGHSFYKDHVPVPASSRIIGETRNRGD